MLFQIEKTERGLLGGGTRETVDQHYQVYFIILHPVNMYTLHTL